MRKHTLFSVTHSILLYVIVVLAIATGGILANYFSKLYPKLVGTTYTITSYFPEIGDDGLIAWTHEYKVKARDIRRVSNGIRFTENGKPVELINVPVKLMKN